jgi:diguanylate cyclase (GGDEF)-like protein
MNFWPLPIPIPVVLAVFAALGYLLGRSGRVDATEAAVRSRREQRRAQLVAMELEKIARELRDSLTKHHSAVSKFRERVGRLGDQGQETAWKDLCREAEEILKPTLRLAAQIASAHEEIRQQSANLMTFTEVRTDPLTGVNNRRGLVDALAGQFAMMNRYETQFSVAMFDIDHFKTVNDVQGHLVGDHVLQKLARLIDESVRETDVVARYGGEEFLIIMPETDLNGAAIFAERLRVTIAEQTQITVSCGIAEALDGDTQDTLVSRADQALYEAKAAGRNCVFRHTGDGSERVASEAATPVTGDEASLQG